MSMSNKKKSHKSSDKVDITSPGCVRIYGIFSFKEEKLLKVSLDMDELEFDFNLEGYNETDYGIVLFDVVLTG
jgi:hypothetical protein